MTRTPTEIADLIKELRTRARVYAMVGDTTPSGVMSRAADVLLSSAERALREKLAALPATPDASSYVIEDSHREGPHLVLKVRYPNCAKCSYEGAKVLVLLNVSEAAALRWRSIDPHFVDPSKARKPTEAPGPAARFPASPKGWQDAIAYVRREAKQ